MKQNKSEVCEFELTNRSSEVEYIESVIGENYLMTHLALCLVWGPRPNSRIPLCYLNFLYFGTIGDCLYLIVLYDGYVMFY